MSESDCRTTVVLPVRLRDELVEHARAADRSLSAEIRVAVREHVTRPASSAAPGHRHSSTGVGLGVALDSVDEAA